RQIFGVCGPSTGRSEQNTPPEPAPSKLAALTVFSAVRREIREYIYCSFILFRPESVGRLDPTIDAGCGCCANASSESHANGLDLERFYRNRDLGTINRKRCRGNKFIPFHHVGFACPARGAREV